MKKKEINRDNIYKVILKELKKTNKPSDPKALAKQISTSVSSNLLTNQQRQVYNSTSADKWETSKEISDRCGIRTSSLAVILNVLEFDGGLIVSKHISSKYKAYKRAL